MSSRARSSRERRSGRGDGSRAAGAAAVTEANPGSALRDSEERMRAVLETAVEGIITIDERGIIESMNPAAERIFGYRAEEIVGHNVSRLMPSPYREEHDRYIANYVRTGIARIIGIGREAVGLRKDGTVFPMDLSISEVRLAARRLFTGFVRDISERKRLEQEILAVSDREQQRIGRDLHDGLGQHLAGIEMMSQVLGKQLATEGRQEAAAQADTIARHVREAIGHARALARGLSPVVVESEGLMAALEELARHTSSLFKVPCRLVCAGPVPVEKHMAALHLFRIAQEAVTNAVKHSGTPWIEIRLQRDAQGVRLAVEDYGRGIDPASLSTRGMGIRIMNYRAGVLGGQCEIRGAPGAGTTVLCVVPDPADSPGS